MEATNITPKQEETGEYWSEKTKNIVKSVLFLVFCVIMALIAGTIGSEPILAFLDWVEQNKVAGGFVFVVLYIPCLVRRLF